MLNNINKIAMDRADYVYKKTQTEEEFIKQDKIIEDIFDKLKKELSGELIDLVGDLRDAINYYDGMFEQELYIQGLRDGIELNKILSNN